MWDSISEYGDLKFQLQRTFGALRVKWKYLERESLIFLSVRSNMENVQRSEMTTENMEELVLYLYCKKAGLENEDRRYQLRKSFRDIDDADWLSEHPKFSGKCELEQKKTIKSIMEKNELEPTACSSVTSAASAISFRTTDEIECSNGNGRAYKWPKRLKATKRAALFNCKSKDRTVTSIVSRSSLLETGSIFLDRLGNLTCLANFLDF